MCKDEAIEKCTNFLISLLANTNYKTENITERHRKSYIDFRDNMRMHGFECYCY